MSQGCALVLLASIARPAIAQSGQATIHGHVVDSASSAPIAGAQVSALGRNLRTQSTADGTFALRVAESIVTPFTLFIQAVGYAPLQITVRELSEQVVRAALRPLTFELADIEIISDAVEENLRSARSALTMDAAAINARRGQTLGETLREAPGVGIIQYGPGIAKPVVRGLHSHRIVTMNRGLRQEGQQWGGEHAPEIDIFEAHEIEVIRGSASVLYGSDALGGVVRIESRPLPQTDAPGGEVVVNSFSNNLQAAGSVMLETGGVDIPFVGRAGVRVRGSVRRAGDAQTPTDNIRNTGFTELDASGTIGIQRRWGESEILVSTYNTTLGLFSGAHVGNLDDLQRAINRGPLPTDFSYEIRPPKQNVTHDAIHWRTQFTSPSFADLELNVGYQRNHRREFDNHGPLAERDRAAFALKLFTYTGLFHVHHAPIGPLTGTIGLSGMHQANVSSGKSFLIPQYWLNAGAAYINETLPLGKLTATVGVRYDFRWQRVFDFRVGNQDFTGEDRTYDGFAGSAGISYLLGSGWSVASSIGSAWRAPNVNERFSLGVHHGTAQYEIGDSSLITERTLNTDLTIRHAGSHAAFEVSGYRNLVRNYMYLHPRDPVLTIRGAFPAFEYQQTDALLYGVDAAMEVIPTRTLSLEGTLSVVRGNNRSLDEPLYDLPADRFSASVRHTWEGGNVVSAPYIQIGGTFVRKQDQVPSETIYSLPVDGYALANLEVGVRHVRLGTMPVSVSLAVRNLFDVAYRDYLSRYKLFIDDPGRDIVLRLQAVFGPDAE